MTKKEAAKILLDSDRIWEYGNPPKKERQAITMAIAALEDSAEPKKGRWIFARYFVWECSECGKNPTKGMGYTQGRGELFRYCPYCGAKMEVKDE